MRRSAGRRANKSVAQGLLGNGGAGGAAGDVAHPLRGRREEEIEGEGNWEMLGVLEGEEGCVAGVAGGDGEAPEQREGTLGSAAVEEAGSARGRSGRIIQEGKESARCHHCRGCSLSVWVASDIKAIYPSRR